MFFSGDDVTDPNYGPAEDEVASDAENELENEVEEDPHDEEDELEDLYSLAALPVEVIEAKSIPRALSSTTTAVS